MKLIIAVFGIAALLVVVWVLLWVFSTRDQGEKN